MIEPHDMPRFVEALFGGGDAAERLARGEPGIGGGPPRRRETLGLEVEVGLNFVGEIAARRAEPPQETTLEPALPHHGSPFYPSGGRARRIFWRRNHEGHEAAF